MDYSKFRVDNHNKWPAIETSFSENEFRDRLEALGGCPSQLFSPAPLELLSDHNYQKCVGRLIDGLVALPARPDFFFDHCFQIIDSCGAHFEMQGIKGTTQGIGQLLISNDPISWNAILDSIASNAPIRTFEYLAKRLVASYNAPTKSVEAQLSSRAASCFGQNRHQALMTKFGASTQSPRTDITDSNEKKLGGFLLAYLHAKPKQPKNPASHVSLDLGKAANMPTDCKRIELLLSLLLFQIRNERAHGVGMSPFRASKSSMDRYKNYYFQMLIAYTFALGAMSLRWPDCISAADISTTMLKNVQLQKSFFP